MKKIPYEKIQELVLDFRELGYHPSVCYSRPYIGFRFKALSVSSDELSLISRSLRGVLWFIERDCYNSAYYYVSFNENNLK